MSDDLMAGYSGITDENGVQVNFVTKTFQGPAPDYKILGPGTHRFGTRTYTIKEGEFNPEEVMPHIYESERKLNRIAGYDVKARHLERFNRLVEQRRNSATSDLPLSEGTRPQSDFWEDLKNFFRGLFD